VTGEWGRVSWAPLIASLLTLQMTDDFLTPAALITCTAFAHAARACSCMVWRDTFCQSFAKLTLYALNEALIRGRSTSAAVSRHQIRGPTASAEKTADPSPRSTATALRTTLAFTCVGWQVTLCDPIWQVTLHSSEMDSDEELYVALALNLHTAGVPLLNVVRLCVCVCMCWTVVRMCVACVWDADAVVFEVWVQVPLKSAHDLCDDVVDTSTYLDDSSDSVARPAGGRDTWHWWCRHYLE